MVIAESVVCNEIRMRQGTRSSLCCGRIKTTPRVLETPTRGLTTRRLSGVPMAVSKRIRFEVLRRDNHTCRYCGGTAPEVRLTVDHVVPVALGGSDDPSNLVAACADCNSGKSSIAPNNELVAQVSEDAIRWAAAIQAAAAQLAGDRARRDTYVAQFDEEWLRWRTTSEDDDTLFRPSSWQSTIWEFYDSALPIEELVDAVLISVNSLARVDDKWRYMCGVAYRKIAKLHEMASASLAEVRT